MKIGTYIPVSFSFLTILCLFAAPACNKPEETFGLTVDFIWSPELVYTYKHVIFQMSTPGQADAYTWTVMDKEYHESQIDIVFPEKGTYPVTLTIDNNPKKTVTKYVDVSQTIPYYNYSGVNIVGKTLSFVCTNIPEDMTVGWDFGDGATGTGDTTSHVYNNEGLYTVKLTFDGEPLKLPSYIKPLTVDILKDPIHTNKFAGSRMWEFDIENIVLGQGSDTTYIKKNENINIEYKDELTVTVKSDSKTIEQGDYKYKKSESKGNILAFYANTGTIYYNHVADSAYFYRFQSYGKNPTAYRITTTGHTQ